MINRKITAAILFLIFISASTNAFSAKIFYTQGLPSSKKVALTFDDGPGLSTKQILEILKEKNVKATFFMTGKQVARFPELAKDVAAAGHEIANHTDSHLNFYRNKRKNKLELIEKELILSGAQIYAITGIKPKLVRFPYGYAKSDAIKIARKNDYRAVINWSFGCDWRRFSSTDFMYRGYLKNIRSGAIFLMHDGKTNNEAVYFLADFIEQIRSRGFEIVTVSQLLDF